ncbi:unnamed protein product [Sphagnum tenellum]
MAAMAPGKLQLHIFSWNKKLAKYVMDGQPETVMQLFQQIQREGMSPDKFTFVQVINARAGLGALEDGRLIHEQAEGTGTISTNATGGCVPNFCYLCGSA